MSSDSLTGYLDSVSRYVEQADAAHRQRYGQFFTPPVVARFMCRWLLQQGPRRLFDPAFGLGSFFFAAREFDAGATFSGVEKDSAVLSHFQSQHTRLVNGTLQLSHADYLDNWGDQHDAIVCNPPYMRFQHFENRHQLLPEIEHNTNRKLSGYTNTASAFLLKSLHELAPGGRLAYLMPLEFLNTGYGTAIKQALLEHGLKAVLRIDPEKDVFPDAITSVGILLVINDGNADSVEFGTIHTLDQLQGDLSRIQTRPVSAANLHPGEKWLPHFDDDPSFDHGSLQPLSLYGSFSRGIATGANDFFVLSRAEADAYELPENVLRPCIARSSQIRKAVLADVDIDQLIDEGERLYLVDLAASDTPAVSRYIESGTRKGLDRRYLTRTRKPWFKLENRPPAPILFGVFSRNGFKAIRNKSRATSLTCFHSFYPNLFGEQYVDQLFLYFRSKAGQTIIARQARKYGDKLDKFEPRDLNQALVPTPEWFSRLPAELVSELMKQLRDGTNVSILDQYFDALVS